MRKKVFMIVMMMVISNIVFAQDIAEPYDFPLKPGMPEWDNLEKTTSPLQHKEVLFCAI